VKKGVFVLLLWLTACAPDPRDVAEADAMRLEAQQAALGQAQARVHQQKMWSIDEAERQAISAEIVRAKAWVIRWAAGSLSVVLVAMGIGLSWGLIGAGRAAAQAAAVRANLIPLDATTRQFPLLLRYVGRGRYTLANPNTGSVVMLDTRRKEDRQLIAASGAVQLAGAIAAEARKSRDPASVAIIRPPIIYPEGGNEQV